MNDQQDGGISYKTMAARALLPVGFLVALYGFMSPIFLNAPESNVYVFLSIGLILSVISLGVKEAWVKQ